LAPRRLGHPPLSGGVQTSGATLSSKPHKYKVLLVDDEYGPRESLSFALGIEFDVRVASDAATGLETASRETFDAIITDIRMPGKMDGIELVRRIREVDPRISIIVLTGFGTLASAQQALLANANEYLKKPPDLDELTASVRKQVRATERRRAAGAMSTHLASDISSALKTSADLSSVIRSSLLNNPPPPEILEASRVVEIATGFCHYIARNSHAIDLTDESAEGVDLDLLFRDVHAILFASSPVITIAGYPGVVAASSRFPLMRLAQSIIREWIEFGVRAVHIEVQQASNACQAKITAILPLDSSRVPIAPPPDSASMAFCRATAPMHRGSLLSVVTNEATQEITLGFEPHRSK